MMNERIKELAIKSGFKKYKNDDGLYSPYIEGYDIDDELEEFAELIIKEVLAVQEQLIAEGHNAWHVNKPTREHFGV